VLSNAQLKRVLRMSDQHFCFLFRKSRVLFSARRPTILAETFRDPPQSIQKNAATETFNKSRPR